MADPAFAEMEAETETLASQVRARNPRADKLNDAEEQERGPVRDELNPLLGPPMLSRQSDKKWYNTPSVRIPCRGVLLT
jgi:hypothetical protein